MTTILAFIFVLGVLVFVHELGHFMAARRIGIRVLTFSLGFGPKLLKVKRGDTVYCISAIPLGGYVKMAGENPKDARTGADDEFLSKSKWQRFQVLIMGPVMNVALALVVMAAVFYQGAPTPAYNKQAVVIGGFGENSPAQAAGLQAGDRVLSVDGDPIEHWEDFLITVGPKAGRRVTIAVERGGATIEATMTPVPQGRYKTGDIGTYPIFNPQVSALTSGQAAEAAGLRVGDVVMAANGEVNATYPRVLELIKINPDKPLALDVRREGAIQRIEITPRKSGDAARIGATFAVEHTQVHPGVLGAIKMSAAQNWDWTKLIGKTLKGLFTRDTPFNQMMGPLGIAEVSGSMASAGWIPLFTFMALISLNLGLFNLLPIPVLDGGHIAIMALEGVARQDFSFDVKMKMMRVGLVLLLALMGTVIYNDIARLEWVQRLVAGPG
ncbi:MAG: RIP metalloprotease RseP [Acidobacteria bacterium]|nr:RIP metalloprotease RseP [Acidobacteriota bacterium]